MLAEKTKTTPLRANGAAVVNGKTLDTALQLTILKCKSADFFTAMELARQHGRRLIETRDFNRLSSHQLEKLRQKVGLLEWFWLGDKPGLDTAQADLLGQKLRPLFNMPVRIWPGDCPLAMGFVMRRNIQSVNVDLTGLGRVRALVFVSEPPEKGALWMRRE